MNYPFDVTSSNVLAVGYRGEVAHGMFRPSTEPNSVDDIDLIAVTMNTLRDTIVHPGDRLNRAKELKQGEWDVVFYPLPKMISLLSQGNPAVLSMLWISQEHIVRTSPYWEYIRERRRAFSGKHVYRTFSGYAYSQLKKMEHTTFQGYMGEKRKKLVEKFGYDTKNASHLIRLLRKGKEFLMTGEMLVDRSLIDREELLAIKDGKYTLNEIKRMAESEGKGMRDAYDQSPLPMRLDMDEILDIHFNVSMAYYQNTKETEYVLQS